MSHWKVVSFSKIHNISKNENSLVNLKKNPIIGAIPPLNTLRLRQNGPRWPDSIFKCIFLKENIQISIKISLKFVPQGLINNIPALVQIMAWHQPVASFTKEINLRWAKRPLKTNGRFANRGLTSLVKEATGDQPLSEPMMASLLTHICYASLGLNELISRVEVSYLASHRNVNHARKVINQGHFSFLTVQRCWQHKQCWKFPQVRQSEADNFGGGLGTFCWFFLNFMLWFQIQGMRTYNFLDWVSNTEHKIWTKWLTFCRCLHFQMHFLELWKVLYFSSNFT